MKSRFYLSLTPGLLFVCLLASAAITTHARPTEREESDDETIPANTENATINDGNKNLCSCEENQNLLSESIGDAEVLWQRYRYCQQAFLSDNQISPEIKKTVDEWLSTDLSLAKDSELFLIYQIALFNQNASLSLTDTFGQECKRMQVAFDQYKNNVVTPLADFVQVDLMSLLTGHEVDLSENSDESTGNSDNKISRRQANDQLEADNNNTSISSSASTVSEKAEETTQSGVASTGDAIVESVELDLGTTAGAVSESSEGENTKDEGDNQLDRDFLNFVSYSQYCAMMMTKGDQPESGE